MASMMDVDNASEMKDWLDKCKPMIKSKMRENIDLRAESVIQIINTCVQTIICDTKSNNIMALISSHNQSLNIFPIDLSSLKHSSKQALYAKVDNWKGLTCSKRKPRYDIKSYFKNADNWWNRYKAEWIGDHFFYPLLHDILPKYIQNMLGLNHSNRYCQPNATYIVSYDLIYFSILHEIFHEQISFARTKFLPLILDQCFNEKKCKYTLQQLLITLGDTHYNPWCITKGDNTRNYAHKWATDILEKIRYAYKEVIMNTGSGTSLYNDDSDVKLEASGVINMSNPPSNNINYEQKYEYKSNPLPYKHREIPHLPQPCIQSVYPSISTTNNNYILPIICPSNNNNNSVLHQHEYQDTFLSDTFPNLSSSSNATISTPVDPNDNIFEPDEFISFNLTPDPLGDCMIFDMESMDGFDELNENIFDIL